MAIQVQGLARGVVFAVLSVAFCGRVPQVGVRTPTMEASSQHTLTERGPLRAALKTARPQEWVKNVLVFAGVIFSGQLDDTWAIGQALLTSACFWAMTTAGYFINGPNDVELDRQHPKKRCRPIAAGQLPTAAAWVTSAGLAIGAIAVAFAVVNWKVGAMVD